MYKRVTTYLTWKRGFNEIQEETLAEITSSSSKEIKSKATLFTGRLAFFAGEKFAFEQNAGLALIFIVHSWCVAAKCRVVHHTACLTSISLQGWRGWRAESVIKRLPYWKRMFRACARRSRAGELVAQNHSRRCFFDMTDQSMRSCWRFDSVRLVVLTAWFSFCDCVASINKFCCIKKRKMWL